MDDCDHWDYDYWLDHLNTLVIETYGIELNDMQDFPTRDWFDDGLSAIDAMNEIIDIVDEYEDDGD